MAKTFLLEEKLAQVIFDYLGTKPAKEVFEILIAMQGLKELNEAAPNEKK